MGPLGCAEDLVGLLVVLHSHHTLVPGQEGGGMALGGKVHNLHIQRGLNAWMELHNEHLLVGVASLGKEILEPINILLHRVHPLVVSHTLQLNLHILLLVLLAEVMHKHSLKYVPASQVKLGGGSCSQVAPDKLHGMPFLHEGHHPEGASLLALKMVAADCKVDVAGGEEGVTLAMGSIKGEGCHNLDGQGVGS